MRAVAELEAEKSRRNERRIELPQLATGAKERLEALSAPAEGVSAVAQPAAIGKAQEILTRARTQAILREGEAYDQEMLSYEARGDLLQARLELATRRVATTEWLTATWRQRVDEQRSQVAKAAVVVGALVGTWLIWAEVLPALSALEKVTLWSTTAESAETVTRPAVTGRNGSRSITGLLPRPHSPLPRRTQAVGPF